MSIFEYLIQSSRHNLSLFLHQNWSGLILFAHTVVSELHTIFNKAGITKYFHGYFINIPDTEA